jgi:hypothetical protein
MQEIKPTTGVARLRESINSMLGEIELSQLSDGELAPYVKESEYDESDAESGPDLGAVQRLMGMTKTTPKMINLRFRKLLFQSSRPSQASRWYKKYSSR